MRDLNFDLLRLQRRAGRDGSHATRRDRSYALAQMANALHEAGYRGLRAKGLKGKHVEALVRHWRDRRLSDATIMNRMAHLRWWAAQVGKSNLVGSNAQYGIGPRSHVSDGTRRRDLDEAKLARVRDAHVRMALRLQAAFGLRREEAIKFTPAYADRGDRLAVRGSTAKGGRPREVPVLTDSQRRLLDEARELAGGGALIPPGRNYAEQRKVYGAGGRTRTADLLITNQLLCQLSYTGTEGARSIQNLPAANRTVRRPRQAGRDRQTRMTTSTRSTRVPAGREGSASNTTAPGSMSVSTPVSTS